MLTFDITPLKPGSHDVVLRSTADDLALDPSTFDNIEVSLRLEVQADRAVARYTARADASLICDRTLERYTQSIGGDHVVLFLPVDEIASRSETPDDVRGFPETGARLDLTEPVRDTLLLALPVRRVAPGAEDREIPTVFPAPVTERDAPADPRWEALRKLRNDS
jgi:uncharacterized protein